MGDNEVRLVKGYLDIQQKMRDAHTEGNVKLAELFHQRLKGIKFGYETYVNHVNKHYGSIEYLIERYHYINGRDD